MALYYSHETSSNPNVGDMKNPSFNRKPLEGGYPQGDCDKVTVLDLLKSLIEEHRENVNIIGHSAGGWVASKVAMLGLQMKTRKARDLSGVVSILYMGAFVIPVGKSIHSLFQPKAEHTKQGVMGLETKTTTTSPVITSVLTNDALSVLPCAYLVLGNNLTTPKEYQEGIVALHSQKTGPLTMYRCPAGHSLHLSWTEGLADIVRDFARKIEG
ncbi:hypothetical protein CC78DRAFT_606020 [Lojkania enalia]|uniref:AB hydrolase-1 domain-containing protein n=1 Tax=Lojkania enalia TaxID=147567 RepID=A0A9P4K5I8_9PLEO|nr:hypothetical protein CC78DRAFT_606020 [Didymosphaeria enalia]